MKNIIIAILTLLLCVLVVKADKASDYRAFADTVRADVFAEVPPGFDVKDIPAKYSGESAVVKAVYENINAKKKTGMGVGVGIVGLPSITRRARVEFGHLMRMLIHVNDKAALDKYSEFAFDTDDKRTFYKSYEKNRHTIGVRLIKPDGRIVDIDTSDFVEVGEGKKGDDKSRKLAVPGLEVGDDIDVFFFTETKLQNIHPDPVDFVLKAEAPILNYNIHCEIDDNLTTQYRTLNGAPDFTVGRDADNNYILDLELKDIAAKEPRLWYNSIQQSPRIMMRIFNRRNSESFTPKSAKKDGLQQNPDVNTMLEDRWDIDDAWLDKGAGYGLYYYGAFKDERKLTKALNKLAKDGTISQRQMADYIYNLLAYAYIGNRYSFDILDFAKAYKDFTKTFGVKMEAGLSSCDWHEPLDQLLNHKHNIYFMRLDGDTARYYFPPTGNPLIIAPGEISPHMQGREAVMWAKKKERKQSPLQFFTIPVTGTDANRNVTILDVTVDNTMLGIRRSEAYRGSTKRSASSLISLEDADKGYSSWLNRYGLNPVIKEKKKETVDREERYADGRKEQVEAFKTEIESYHGSAPAEFIDGRITDIGIDPDQPDLCYDTEYRMDGYVKRAGANLLISVGKLLSEQIELLPTDRDRKDDLYIGNPREYRTVINLVVPDGYEVNAKSLEALKTTVKGKDASFDVEAEEGSGKITVTVVKQYLSPTVAIADWPEFAKVVDAANAWNSSVLAFERL